MLGPPDFFWKVIRTDPTIISIPRTSSNPLSAAWAIRSDQKFCWFLWGCWATWVSPRVAGHRIEGDLPAFFSLGSPLFSPTFSQRSQSIPIFSRFSIVKSLIVDGYPSQNDHKSWTWPSSIVEMDPLSLVNFHQLLNIKNLRWGNQQLLMFTDSRHWH